MAKIISSIKPERIPDWFSEMISGKRRFPDSLKETIKKKAEEVYDKLYS